MSDWEYPIPELCPSCGLLVRDYWRKRPCLKEEMKIDQYLETKIDAIAKLRLTMWPDNDEFNMVQVDHDFGVLMEEAGELRGAIRDFIGRPYKPEQKGNREHIVEELGDTLVPIIALSNMLDITFSEALDAALYKLLARKTKFDEERRIQHIIKTDAQ